MITLDPEAAIERLPGYAPRSGWQGASRCARPLSTSLLLIFAATAWAQENAFVTDAEPSPPSSVRPGDPWREAATRLPPWPKDSDLIEYRLDGPQGPFRYFVDGKHLQVGPDGVVRYTLVAEGRSGTRNVSFEGIRCTPRGTYKVFAYGAAGRFSTLTGADWQPFSRLESERYRDDLWRYHLCIPREFRPRPKKDMLRSLRGYFTPGQNSGFQSD